MSAGFSVELMDCNVQQTVQKLSGAVHPGKTVVIGSLDGAPRRSWWILPRCPVGSGALNRVDSL